MKTPKYKVSFKSYDGFLAVAEASSETPEGAIRLASVEVGLDSSRVFKVERITGMPGGLEDYGRGNLVSNGKGVVVMCNSHQVDGDFTGTILKSNDRRYSVGVPMMLKQADFQPTFEVIMVESLYR